MRERFTNLVEMRRVAIVAVAAAGVGLFGTGVRGLTQLDGQLADATPRPTTHEVKLESEGRGDCPWDRAPGERRL
jgi:hypothetical protein